MKTLFLGLTLTFVPHLASATSNANRLVFTCVESEPLSDSAIFTELYNNSQKELFLQLGYFENSKKYLTQKVPVYRQFDSANRLYVYRSFDDKAKVQLRTEFVNSRGFSGVLVSNRTEEVEMDCDLPSLKNYPTENER